MVARLALSILTILALAFAVIGAVVLPAGALVGWSLMGLAIGTVWWKGATELPQRFRLIPYRPNLWNGLGIAAGFTAGCLAIAGMATVLGGPTTVSLLAISFAAVIWAGWWRTRLRPAAPAERHVPVVPRPLPPAIGEMPTDELCVAWRRSYLELQRATDEAARQEVVRIRREYLDELERRDRAGFVRWLDSGARAGSDPRRYLTH